MNSNMKMEVKIKALPADGNLLAIAGIKFNDCLVVDGFHIVNGTNGLFVGMPSTVNANGNYRDVVFPVTAEFREELTTAVLEGYYAAVQRAVRVLEGN